MFDLVTVAKGNKRTEVTKRHKRFAVTCARRKLKYKRNKKTAKNTMVCLLMIQHNRIYFVYEMKEKGRFTVVYLHP